jgi:hypothetical protein
VVVGFCDDALEIDPAAPGAAALRQQAQRALADEAKQRRSEAEQALERADVLRRKKNFAEAARAIATAKEIDPAVPHEAAEARLQASIDEEQRSAEVARQAGEAIEAARRRFASGERTEAIADLGRFHQATPEASAAAEISRMEMEAQRIAAAEARKAEVARLAADAESALSAGDAKRALELGTRALAIAPADEAARKVSGAAGAVLKQRAEAEARAQAAARHLEDARQQLARGKFQKARELVSAAADLTPADPAHKVVLARIQEEEARAEAEAERQRVARQRAKAVAPILERARAAEARGDFDAAMWMAENALAVDLDCAEAKQILERAKARVAANPQLAEETVDLPDENSISGDPDDTASLTQPAGFWQRLAEALRGWRPRDTAARQRTAAPARAPETGIKGRTQ